MKWTLCFCFMFLFFLTENESRKSSRRVWNTLHIQKISYRVTHFFLWEGGWSDFVLFFKTWEEEKPENWKSIIYKIIILSLYLLSMGTLKIIKDTVTSACLFCKSTSLFLEGLPTAFIKEEKDFFVRTKPFMGKREIACIALRFPTKLKVIESCYMGTGQGSNVRLWVKPSIALY